MLIFISLTGINVSSCLCICQDNVTSKGGISNKERVTATLWMRNKFSKATQLKVSKTWLCNKKYVNFLKYIFIFLRYSAADYPCC